jgi:hypothetical protein
LGILDSTSEEPSSKLRRYILTGAIFVALVAGGVWWGLRFHSEKRAVRNFMDAVVAGEMRRAFQMWKPSASYSFQDFVSDWGPNGYYGPVKSYVIESVDQPDAPRGTNLPVTGVVIVVELSQYQPFPDPKDTVKSRRNKEARIWVESKDLSLSYAP